MDVVKEDMAEAEVTEEDTVDRNNWRRKIHCRNPWWEKPKEEEDHCLLLNLCPEDKAIVQNRGTAWYFKKPGFFPQIL